MKKIIAFLVNLRYVFVCLFFRNPNNPNAPQLYRLKKGDRLKPTFYGKHEYEYTIVRVYWYFDETDFDLSPKAIVKYKDEDNTVDIYLSDEGIVPYKRAGWHKNRIPFFASQSPIA